MIIHLKDELSFARFSFLSCFFFHSIFTKNMISMIELLAERERWNGHYQQSKVSTDCAPASAYHYHYYYYDYYDDDG